ncbi:MAG: 7-cyano-7-deazaguanine reductase [Microthrixaceae bacterium]
MSGSQGSGGETGDSGTGGTGGGVELPELTLLGRTVGPGESTTLEFFPVDAPVRVTFRTQELQALCPAVAGIQPDLYSAEISYTAQTHAVESKSLKLWLVGFRDRRIFAEHLVVELHDHLAAYAPALSDVRVRLEQQVRGGIVTVVEHPV